MKEYSYRQSPIEVYGVPFFKETGRLERLPEAIRTAIPRLEFLGRRVPGGRFAFRTDSKKLTVKVVFETLTPDIGMSLYTCQSAYVYRGSHSQPTYLGHVFPVNYDQKVFSKTFDLPGDMDDILIYMPRNEIIADMTVSIDEDAQLLPPTPYAHPLPVVFYGSSITEGGCCSKISTGYNSILSSWLDCDFFNMGFSGAARGEFCMADYLSTLPMSVFVCDYDHNAPSADFLKATHEPFFRRFREHHPDTPVVFMTMPDFKRDADAQMRREIIHTTYENALASGDKNVYFVDGGSFFPAKELPLCSNDLVHPNDLGMFRMAEAVYPVLDRLLNA